MANEFPPGVLSESMVGSYPTLAKSGAGFVWDEVLEYRVWCCPACGAPDQDDGSDYFYAFASWDEAKTFSDQNPGTKEPLALVLQREWISEEEAGQYVHRTGDRVTEWPVEFLSRPRRTPNTIPDFVSPDAPANRLDILRGLAPA